MTFAWLFAILLGLLLLFALYLYTSRRSPVSISYSPLRAEPPPPEVCLRENRDTFFLDLPLVWDRRLGLYMTTVSMNGRSFRTVPDTGSTNLLISGSQCASCNPRDGVFDMREGLDISRGQVRQVAYGGGQKTIYIPWRAHLDVSPTRKEEIDFGVIVQNTSPDGLPLNVLGLSSRGFLSTLCGEHTIVFDFLRGRLTIGRNPTFINNPGLTAPIRIFPSPYSVPFVLTRVKSITVNGTPLPTSILPRYLLIDTGTTSTITNPALAQALIPGKIDIILEGLNGEDVPISFENRRGDVEVGKLQVPDAIIVGNQWLNEYAVAFQYDQNSIQFSR